MIKYITKMSRKYFILTFFLAFVLQTSYVQAQEEVITAVCDKYMLPPFVSDGQQYRALINTDEVAEFRATFYGGSVYRITACSGKEEGQLIFSIYDRERNELFSNRGFNNAPYWDFKFNSTVDCIIEAYLAPTGPTSGFAILQIGFSK